MVINDIERKRANELIEKFLRQKDKLPYANIGRKNEYLGWVDDFHLKDYRDEKIRLDLSKENDLFLLFILAVGWSRSDKWENSPFFVAYLKLLQKDSLKLWLEASFCAEEQNFRFRSAELMQKELTGINRRYKVSFRKDIFNSVHVLAKNWNLIIEKLKDSEKNRNYESFIYFLGAIEGLGAGKKTMKKKIFLILRELRCQNRFQNIPGELCCVTDTRVIKSAEKLGIFLPKLSNLKSLINSSSKIYSLFGDLYDIPLFAYEDLE